MQHLMLATRATTDSWNYRCCIVPSEIPQRLRIAFGRALFRCWFTCTAP
jgi:hypothetical protein